ncbi:hypothetical protein [Paenibacillus roseipurpureus]|uniref:Uncharacterized protein n=1 Tax=Paenibacillus roseopurpureus TaxID=2918901 RepID=A0AA96LRU5_9BACL|nr:hypothetical protein [Paenibacillus sp. MBLB1832]WNR46875.1 hypothetical protein MJB10_12535 [Paenibacillus sp. MBLB1832]
MKNRVLIQITFNYETSVLEKDILQIGTKFFVPSKMKGKAITGGSYRKYNEKKFIDGLVKEEKTDNGFIYGMKDELGNWVTFTKALHYVNVSMCLLDAVYDDKMIQIMNEIDTIVCKYNVIVARVCSLEDDFWQNNEDPQFYEVYGKSMEGIKTKYSTIYTGEQIIDVEYNPGHSHIANEIWFGSCWSMWFSKGYYKFIPKEVLESFKSCFKNDSLKDDVIKIVLHPRVWDFALTENREKQWAFRRWTGIDEVAHYYMNQSKISNDPAVSIDSEVNCQHGGLKRITYFFDNKDEIVPKSKAYKSKTYELDETGTVIWSSEELMENK